MEPRGVKNGLLHHMRESSARFVTRIDFFDSSDEVHEQWRDSTSAEVDPDHPPAVGELGLELHAAEHGYALPVDR